MNEEIADNQYSPINNDSDNCEMTNRNLDDDKQLDEHESNDFNELNQKQLIEEDNLDDNLIRENDKEEIKDDNKNFNLTNREQIDNNKRNLNNLENDEISDENFKDDELDFEEEGDNSRGDNNLKLEEKKQKAAEDGEVNSEEELEDGEVKEDDDSDDTQIDDPNKQTQANLNSLCRFYSKGLCTWGSNCRFIHQKPIGTSSTYASKLNQQINQPPKQNIINKPPNDNSNKNPNYLKHNQQQQSNYTKIMNISSSSSNSFYNQNDNQYERNTKYVKKDTIYSKSYRTPSTYDQPDYDQQPQIKNKYQMPLDESRSSNYTRNSQSSSYYTSSSKNLSHHQTSSTHISSSTNYHRSSTSSRSIQSGSQQYEENEYERKCRLAFEAAPWNDNNNDLSPSLQHSARSSPLDRHSQSSSSKLYGSKSSNKYSSKQIDNAEQYRDVWRKSKSPYKSPYNSNRHQQPQQSMYRHSQSKSDSGSNFSDPELIDQQLSHKKRLDPNFANKHRPPSFRDDNGDQSYHHSSYDNKIADHPSSSSLNKKSYYKQHHQTDLIDEPSKESPYHQHSSYSKSQNTTPTPPTNEIDIPNYERPKNVQRTRKDSWSDSDSSNNSCSSNSHNSSFSGSGSESENSDNEPYSRTNKFESTREIGNKVKKGGDVFNSSEPQNKRQRTISEHSRISSKNELSKSRSPYSPNESPTPYTYSSSGRKKQRVNNEIGSPYDDEDGLESNERTSSDRNGSSGNSDDKKIELLQQLKAVEEAISRKRAKQHSKKTV